MAFSVTVTFDVKRGFSLVSALGESNNCVMKLEGTWPDLKRRQIRPIMATMNATPPKAPKAPPRAPPMVPPMLSPGHVAPGIRRQSHLPVVLLSPQNSQSRLHREADGTQSMLLHNSQVPVQSEESADVSAWLSTQEQTWQVPNDTSVGHPLPGGQIESEQLAGRTGGLRMALR